MTQLDLAIINSIQRSIDNLTRAVEALTKLAHLQGKAIRKLQADDRLRPQKTRG